MNWKTMLLAAVCVVLAGWLTAWQVWEAVKPKPIIETVAKDQAGIQGQLNYVQSQMDGLKKEVADLKKAVQIYKRAVLEAKGRVLNADQDIHKFVQEALKEEPVRDILSTPDLVERARKIGLTTLKVQK